MCRCDALVSHYGVAAADHVLTSIVVIYEDSTVWTVHITPRSAQVIKSVGSHEFQLPSTAASEPFDRLEDSVQVKQRPS